VRGGRIQLDTLDLPASVALHGFEEQARGAADIEQPSRLARPLRHRAVEHAAALRLAAPDDHAKQPWVHV
jgi:hypothetical protein